MGGGAGGRRGRGAGRAAATAAAATTRAQPRLGPALRRAWVAYQRRVDDSLHAAGFDDRRFPDGRVLRLCRGEGVTVAAIGRELGVSRQAAGKLVAGMRARGYVSVAASRLDGREKVVRATARAGAYLDAQRAAVRAIERRLRAELGAETVDAITRIADVLGRPDDDLRLREYLRTKGVRDL